MIFLQLDFMNYLISYISELYVYIILMFYDNNAYFLYIF